MHKAHSSPPTFRMAGTEFRERITYGRNLYKKKINIPVTDHIFNNDLQDRLGAEAMARMLSHFDRLHDIAIANLPAWLGFIKGKSCPTTSRAEYTIDEGIWQEVIESSRKLKIGQWFVEERISPTLESRLLAEG